MLKQRLITALILVVLLVWAIFGLGHKGFAAAMAVIMLIGAWEWSAISGAKTIIKRSVFTFVMAAEIGVLIFLMHDADFLPWLSTVNYTVAFVWLFISIWIVLYNKNKEKYAIYGSTFATVFNLLLGMLVLGGAFLAIIELHRNINYGPGFLLSLMLLIWVADSGAYFSGKTFGKHKLIPNVSPGKSWEGVYGALLAVTVVSILMIYISGQYDFNDGLRLLVIAIITTIISVFGDLAVSMFKRNSQLKDSGNILPGHGGVLDRIDSLLAAMPFYLAGLTLVSSS